MPYCNRAMPAVRTLPRNEGSALANSKASRKCLWFTVLVKSSTNLGGMATPKRRSIDKSTMMATRPRRPETRGGRKNNPAEAMICRIRFGC